MSADDVFAGSRDVPNVAMPEQTLVMGLDRRQLLWIDGVLLLPLGARIELAEPRMDAVVEGVRLWDTRRGKTPTLVLDVRLVAP
jgi:hypothetical protein